MIDETYDEVLQLQSKGKTKEVTKEQTVTSSRSQVEIELMTISKWGGLHKQSQEPTSSSASITPLVKQEALKLIKRYERLISGKTFTEVKDAIEEMSDIKVIKKLLTYNDKTLSAEKNIEAIVEERIERIKVIEDELVITSTTSSPTDSIPHNLSSL